MIELKSKHKEINRKFIDEFLENSPAFFEVLDSDIYQEIIDFQRDADRKYENYVLCGIGGSALGADAVLSALNKKNIEILDSISPEKLEKIAKRDLSKTLFIFVSKSGTTTETISQYFFFREKIESQSLFFENHSVFITGKKGFFREIAEKERIDTFLIPEEIGGRFSVFTPVGLLPLALAEVDIKDFLEGAKNARENYLDTAYIQAKEKFEQKKPIHVLFIYSDELEKLGKFYQQLLGESIGKTDKIGITPHISIGTRDQHSDLQLFAEGPDDKTYTFLNIKNQKNVCLPEIKEKKFLHFSEKSFESIISSAQEGTYKSLEEKKRPLSLLEMDKISAYSLGEIMFLFMTEIAILGKMYKIDTFNQPGVERGKTISKKILSTKGITFIELMVVVIIMSLLFSSLVRIDFRNQKRASFFSVAEEAMTGAVSARNFSLSNRSFDLGNGIEVVPEGGIGVNINKANKTLTFFIDNRSGDEADIADANKNIFNGLYDNTDDSNDFNDDYLLSREIPSYTILEDNIDISSITGDDVEITSGEVTIIFRLTNDEIIINNNTSGTNYAEYSDLAITFSHQYGTVDVSINKISRFFSFNFIALP